ncbi:TPA: 30S ribosomal protein S16 [Candidatus Saccharibacteria bacterium]|nr:MAG: 30S ribosomal protein S16 [Candidatus Saccharibacteria bacterium GW2011_GWA2_46_10]OGL34323.1 MAG: 30S ribosomal protein S16 [Candidatus Saccharibacteria bacterium RIFCSPHIGHO2_12_FULL_47_17]HCM51558.1 30S ribosomal protein S16 [Candidatus Saccharibacteria bacterium]
MLSLRLKRTGRTGHAQFRLIAQDRRFSPKSGRIAAYLGSYNPHTKKAEIDVEKINAYLKNGAQPSPKVAKLLKKEGVKLPSWVAKPSAKKRAIRHPEKLRRNRSADAEPVEAPAGEPAPVKEEKVAPKSAEQTADLSAETHVKEEASVGEAPLEADKPVTKAADEEKTQEAATEASHAQEDKTVESNAEVEQPAETEKPKQPKAEG